MSNAVEPRGLSKIGLQINGWLVYLFFYAPIVLLVIFFSLAKVVTSENGADSLLAGTSNSLIVQMREMPSRTP